jgi:hypothetical protein
MVDKVASSDMYDSACWDLYNRIPRVTQTCDLHSAGFAFGEPRLTVPASAELGLLSPIVVSTDVLREIGRDLFVTGRAQANVIADGNSVRIERGGSHSFSFSSSSSPSAEPGGLSALVPNHRVLTEPRMASLAPNLLSPMLRVELLSSASAARLSGGQIADALVVFVAQVKSMKETFSGQLRQHLKGKVRVLAVNWEPEWLPSLALRGPFNYGCVYQVFKGQGIDLVNLRNEVVKRTTELASSGLIAPSTAADIVSAFDG